LTEELHQIFRLMRLAHQPVILLLSKHYHAILALPRDALWPSVRARRKTSLKRALAL